MFSVAIELRKVEEQSCLAFTALDESIRLQKFLNDPSLPGTLAVSNSICVGEVVGLLTGRCVGVIVETIQGECADLEVGNRRCVLGAGVGGVVVGRRRG